MSVKSVQLTSLDSRRSSLKKQDNQVAFKGVGNPVITLMDAIDRGGFAASFIVQDFLGMAAPRIGTGMYRNHDKTGKLNWDFAKKEGIREILSGPSTFMIPAAMMVGIKKFSGSSNNVPIDFINALGETFTKYAVNNTSALSNVAETKQNVYTEYFKNVLSSSTNNAIVGEELEKTASSFAKKALEAENAKPKSFWKNLVGTKVEGSAQDLQKALQDEFSSLLKKHNGAESDKLVAKYTTENGSKVATSFKNLLGHMKDYTDDAVKHVNKKLEASNTLNVDKYLNNLTKRRSGTRFLSNTFMYLAVVAFYTMIPKLYNLATKGRDPGLDGLDVDNSVKSKIKGSKTEKANDSVEGDKKQVAFTGKMTPFQNAMANLGVAAKKPGSLLNKLSNVLEFEGATLSMPAMLLLLFGFCLPPRLMNAQSQTDRKEILFRDITSFFSILFGAKIITRACSDLFAKTSGLALNIKPETDNMFKKIWNYIYPSGGVKVLDSESIVANYSKVGDFKNGINDMFKFIKENGGNVGKMLNIDPEISKNAKEILGKVPDKNMKFADIVKAFDNAKGTEAYNKIIEILSNEGNKVVKKAKTLNSAFGFASTVFLVPALMMWISKHCEKMTKLRIAEQQKQAQEEATKLQKPDLAMQVLTSKPTMAGFLNRQ